MRAAAAAALFVIVLAGCAPGNAPDTADAAAPEFVGPYAEEFAQTWADGDAFVRGVVEDEQISAQEWAETTGRLRDCVESHGMTLTEYEDDGAYAVDPGAVDGDRANTLLGECEQSSGESVIGRLRSSVQTNPQNRDIDEIMHECLIRIGAVGSEYTLEEYRRDTPDFGYPFLTADGPALYDTCSADPVTAGAE